MTFPKTAEAFRPLLNEIWSQTDRGMAIIASSMMEELLKEALEKRLILTNALKEKLFSFEKSGPLSSFSSKIDLGYSIGVLKAEHRDDLHLVRRIRNKFAHRLEPIDFKDNEITIWCVTLKCPRPLKAWSGMPPRLSFYSVFMCMLSILGIYKLHGTRLELDASHLKGDQWLEVVLNAVETFTPLTPDAFP